MFGGSTRPHRLATHEAGNPDGPAVCTGPSRNQNAHNGCRGHDVPQGDVCPQIDVDDKKQFAASYRAVQRFLKAQGYKRGHRKGSSTYHLSKANALARDTYVKLMHPHSTAATRPNVVYTDESCIHHHYKSHHQDLYDPSDDHDVQSKEKHKGRRYCFVAGILDSPTMASKVMALAIFTGGKSRPKEPKDYHGMFDHVYYVKWFGRLLDEMDASGVTKALISILLDACRLYGIQTTGKEFKSELWDMLASHIKPHILPVIVEMAKCRGHCVVYTPPHHSDLQPIETVWAIVKGKVGRRYTDMTKFADVKVRLEAAFANLKPNSIKWCVRAAQEKLKKLHEHLVQIDTLVSDEESSDDSDNSSDDGGDSE
ncbi:hypothetical protein DYB26_012633 [Aphanomyces astaci]|uniref:Tc1-like transposase DDE domain-containing protein n=1 Tax=Aphanomyces astaci TaxID=112090 RepID=A0A397FFL5_APHAT|nr:hypothetical protein DYB31_012581 [Aphanomyces astaci]RHZ32763.1 hypothetical protein DYB26_012633 [Aphanomyces astaci]